MTLKAMQAFVQLILQSVFLEATWDQTHDSICELPFLRYGWQIFQYFSKKIGLVLSIS